jgi:hypothetical protein
LVPARGRRAAPAQGRVGIADVGRQHRRRGHLVLVHQPQFLEDKHVTGLSEGREHGGVGDVVGRVGVAGVDAAKKVEDELRVQDEVADVAERARHGLHAPAKLGDGGFTLLHGMELVVEEDGVRLLVAAPC